MTIRGVSLHPSEQVVHVERMALSPFLPRLCFGVLLIVLPFFAFFPLLSFGLVGMVMIAVVAGCGIFVVARVAVQWRGTMCLLTSERIISIEQHSLLQRAVSEASVRTINEVAYRTYGWMGKLAHMGTVRVVFRGVVPDMLFSPVHHPGDLTRLIHELRDVPAHGSGDGTFARKHLNT